MHIERAALEAAIAASGGAEQPPDEFGALFARLQVLEATGRHDALLRSLLKANDKSNFLAVLLEAAFAYHFEAAGIPLEYELKQDSESATSVDFGMKLGDGRVAYLELRLLQQDQATASSIAQQLAENRTFQVAKDGEDERAEVLRLQSTILSKVENADGKPVKFLKVDEGTINIVVVCVSDILLGTADRYDCILATYGDPAVPPECRRDVFGLFQDGKADYPEHVKRTAARFEHIRSTIHGVLFLFRPKGSGPLSYSLRQFLVWNRWLIARESAQLLCDAVRKALPALE